MGPSSPMPRQTDDDDDEHDHGHEHDNDDEHEHDDEEDEDEKESYGLPRNDPTLFRGRIRSQNILKVARSGTASSVPVTPQR
jgi:hypothetical protein